MTSGGSKVPFKTSRRATKQTTASTTKRTRTRRHVATHDAIAVRAYELYVAGSDGDHLSHWLQAERELAAR